MDIVTVKLISGEEFVAGLDKGRDDDGKILTFHYPSTFMSMQGPDGTQQII